jgi:hypothetical protein
LIIVISRWNAPGSPGFGGERISARKLVAAHAKEGRRRSLLRTLIPGRENGAPSLEQPVKRGKIVLPLKIVSSGAGRIALPPLTERFGPGGRLSLFMTAH